MHMADTCLQLHVLPIMVVCWRRSSAAHDGLHEGWAAEEWPRGRQRQVSRTPPLCIMHRRRFPYSVIADSRSHMRAMHCRHLSYPVAGECACASRFWQAICSTSNSQEHSLVQLHQTTPVELTCKLVKSVSVLLQSLWEEHRAAEGVSQRQGNAARDHCGGGKPLGGKRGQGHAAGAEGGPLQGQLRLCQLGLHSL